MKKIVKRIFLGLALTIAIGFGIAAPALADWQGHTGLRYITATPILQLVITMAITVMGLFLSIPDVLLEESSGLRSREAAAVQIWSP